MHPSLIWTDRPWLLPALPTLSVHTRSLTFGPTGHECFSHSLLFSRAPPLSHLVNRRWLFLTLPPLLARTPFLSFGPEGHNCFSHPCISHAPRVSSLRPTNQKLSCTPPLFHFSHHHILNHENLLQTHNFQNLHYSTLPSPPFTKSCFCHLPFGFFSFCNIEDLGALIPFPHITTSILHAIFIHHSLDPCGQTSILSIPNP